MAEPTSSNEPGQEPSDEPGQEPSSEAGQEPSDESGQESRAELPPTLSHQMDGWDEQVRDQQLAFVDAAEDLEARAQDIRQQLETAEEIRRPNLEMHLDLVTKLAANVRTMARIPFPIPDEGITVREEPDAPDGLVYVDPAEAGNLFRSQDDDPEPDAS